MTKETEISICPRCRSAISERGVLLNGMCEECVQDRERMQGTKERLFRKPLPASEHNILEKHK